MICYKDITFCASTEHKPDCDRRVTKELEAEAKAFGLPIAYAYFCGEPKLKGAEDFIRSGWGGPCKTKDTHDFPELRGDPLAKRCPICEIWERYYDYAQGMYESPEVSTDE